MKRKAVITIAACLALGVVINVGVAWACAYWGRDSGLSFGYAPPQSVWKGRVPEDWPAAPVSVSTEHYLCISVRSEYGRFREEPIHGFENVSVRWVFSGLPIRSMVTQEFSLYSDGTGPTGVYTWPDGLVNRWRCGFYAPGQNPIAAQSFNPIPIRPSWTGFVVNTLAYFAILLLPIVYVGKLRRHREHRRLQRGHCPRCDYQLTSDSSCPECGWKAKQMSAETVESA